MGSVKLHVNEISKDDLEKDNKFHCENDDFEIMRINEFLMILFQIQTMMWRDSLVSCFYQSWHLK